MILLSLSNKINDQLLNNLWHNFVVQECYHRYRLSEYLFIEDCLTSPIWEQERLNQFRFIHQIEQRCWEVLNKTTSE